ncbi:hypothetical protein O6H91_04G058900 [Diphasiastrum complanatum]|uniref:Uncharacterized protein n=1 Tax=Diphasiastrum complanatum TaxID=34168 RepID=A0ACC2DXX5_DIPCM|nr:hypothetical protein O6H91_04G058900 [Diphasiastrum complanatum]
MALRDLVMGGAGCAVPDSNGAAGASSSNPLGGFASSLLGSSSKTQERLRELPALPGPGQLSSAEYGPLTSLPGSEYDQELSQQRNAKGSAFLRGFYGGDQQGYADAWNDVTQNQLPPGFNYLRPKEEPPIFSDFEQIYNQEAAISGRQPYFEEPPQQVLSGFLRSFLDSSREEVPFYPVRLPELGLSAADKQRIRDRSSIMARHFFAEKGDDYVNAQVTALLQSLDIEDNIQAREPLGGRLSELEQYWNESHSAEAGSRWRGMAQPATETSNRWVEEYSQHRDFPSRHESWAQEFQSQHDSDSWANQFSEMTERRQLRDGNFGGIGALEQTRSLVDTLSKNQDPKFQNSKFLQFVSKMSRGELIVEDNHLKASPALGDSWANEYHTQHASNPEVWASEFAAGERARYGNTWVDEFGGERQDASATEQWVREFSAGDGTRDWADEFGDRLAKGMFEEDSSADGWLDSYNKFVEEQVRGEQQLPASSKWLYVFADQNPYVGHPNPLKEGQDLFRRGLLSEAVLALEAEVLKNPDNAEGWRLLGITHAENDDDRQAIASMVRARDADPANLEVLLALGVSHTNELEQAEALKYLRGWLQNHPLYGKLVPPVTIDRLNHSEVARLFNEAAAMSPEDGDVHTVLGVLYNLSREYDKAIQAFQTALKLKPRDYSLWNKLGATQANSARSADAINAYQQALDLKPNYVRAWSNMGIGYANQGRYEESIQYYVRALCMNPKADNAWQYLRISLSCAKRMDLLDACEQRDLDLLQKEFPF